MNHHHRVWVLASALLTTSPWALASLALGPTDTASGLQWGYAASLADGQAEGFRPASFADLSLLLKDGGFSM